MTKWVRRLLVVEDTPLMASLLVESLTSAGYDVRAAASATAALDAIDDFDPDALLLDIDLGDGPSGVDLALRVHREHPDIAITFLTRLADLGLAGGDRKHLPPGSVYINKSAIADVADLVEGIEAALAGEAAHRPLPPLDPGTPGADMLLTLTPTQLQVLRLASAGYTNAAIARRRGTSERAVEMLLQSASTRLGVVAESERNTRVVTIRRYLEAAGLAGASGE
ncbi:MAG: response regulator transcription factor [Actinobacteria bacterium]|nr:MAG: response regulator transcription factor [Actinomycetota bacterium]